MTFQHGDDTTDVDTVTDYRTEIGHYRRPLLGVPWIAALILVPALLAAVGLGVQPPATAAPTPSATATSASPTASSTPSVTATATPSATPTALAAAFGLIQSADGKTVTLTGNVPDAAAKAALVKATQAAYGTGVTVTDNLTVTAGAPALTAATFGPLATALKGVPGVAFNVAGTTITITGVAPGTARAAVLDAIGKAYPGATIDSGGLQQATSATTTASPTTKASAATPTCATASDDVKAVTDQTKILFDTKTTALTADSQAALAKIAAIVKGCSGVKLLVAGNTDWVGDPDANKKLSLTRANAIKDALVKLGVAAANITTVGNGETKPIASNQTLAGREANRRVDITVQ